VSNKPKPRFDEPAPDSFAPRTGNDRPAPRSEAALAGARPRSAKSGGMGGILADFAHFGYKLYPSQNRMIAILPIICNIWRNVSNLIKFCAGKALQSVSV
jgi:hypothetical protein